jgi:hypothetical protein
MANTYDIGDLVRITGTFVLPTGTATDPTTIRVIVQDPSGNESAYVYGSGATVGKTSTGIYYADISVDEAGEWPYRWTGTTACQSATESYWLVRERIV